MRRLTWKKQTKRFGEPGDFPLQITSLADVFTILLVFLLKSYASSAAFFQPSAGLALPSTLAEGSQLPEALRLEVLADGILLDGKFITKDLTSEQARDALKQALQLARHRQSYLRERNPELKADDRLLIVADRRLSYESLLPALRLAGAAGYGDLRWVISTEASQ
jgi:biopolymer transport protein ExbD